VNQDKKVGARLYLIAMKYILFIAALVFAVSASAQNNLAHTPNGDLYQIFTHNTGDKLKLDDVVTFEVIEKTDKDSLLGSTYVAGQPAKARIQPSQNAGDLMQVFPLLTVNDSVLVKVPTDSIFKGHEDQRPAFLPKGSCVNYVLKITKVQSLNEAIAERNAAIEKMKAEEAAGAAKNKVVEDANIAKYIASHKLILKTTPSGLKYKITKPSLKPKPLPGDTLLVNYAGYTLEGKVFDSSIESVAKAAGLNQPGRTYEPLEMVVGAGGIIQGWDEGLQLLNEGAKAMFIIPSNLGYGSQSSGPDIKPYTTLVFDLELVKIKPTKHPVVAKPPLKKPLAKKKPVKKS